MHVTTSKSWRRRRLVLLRRSSRGPLRLLVMSPGDVDQLIHLNDYTFIARVDPAVRPHTLAISFRTRPCFRFSAESGQYNTPQSLQLSDESQLHLSSGCPLYGQHLGGGGRALRRTHCAEIGIFFRIFVFSSDINYLP